MKIVETQWRESTVLKNWWPSWNSCHNLSRPTNPDSLMRRSSRGENAKIPCSQWEKYFIGNTTCSPENVCSPLSTRRRRWISCQELARSTRHSAQERGKEFRFQKSNWIHIRGKLLVRSRICCCKPCLERNWQNCELKVCLCTVTLYNVQCTYWNLI